MIPIFGIGFMLIGTLFSLLLPKGDRRHTRAIAVFVLGAVILVTDYLFKNPDLVEQIQAEWVAILLGIVFVFIQALKRR